MKKLILLFIALLLLNACGVPELACEDQDARHLQWNGIEYTMPACWTKNETQSTLILTSFDGIGRITMSFDATEVENKTSVGGSKSLVNAKGETVYVTNNDGSNDESRAIFSSVEVALLDIAGQSCEAPDSTYPQSYTEYWNGYQFSLPWCWSAKEDPYEHYVTLLPGDNDSGDMTFSFFKQADTTGITKGISLTFGGNTFEVYSFSDRSSLLKFSDDFYIATPVDFDSNDPNVQLILSSITKL